MRNNFYVYAYLRENDTPYYIGKGTGRRAYQKNKKTHKYVNVPDGVLVVGIPAKIIRQLTSEECKQLKDSAYNYILYAKSFQNIKRVDKI